MNKRISVLSAGHMDAILVSAKRHLGEDHNCAKAISDAVRTHGIDASERVISAVRGLPPHYRDVILLEAKKRVDEEAATLNWLLRHSGLPDDVPPDVTRN